MNSQTAQLTENGTEIVRLFARFALGASFLSAVADRFWLMGATWSKERILGRFRSFRGIHGRGDVSLPQFIDGVVCMGSYRRGDPLGILLIAGFKIRMASVLSGLLLLSFAMGMVTGLGIKTPFDYSVFSAPLQHSYWRSGSLTDSRWTSF